MAGFDTLLSACPPLVEYGPDEQSQVADEIAALPEGGVIVEWLMDYVNGKAKVSQRAEQNVATFGLA